MKKSIFIILLMLVIIVIGIITGIYLNHPKLTIEENEIKGNGIELTEVEENTIEISEEVVADEEKTTPNTLLVFVTYYTKCKHYINDYQEIDISNVNLNEEEFTERYKEWEITSFSPKQITLERSIEEYCNEHYELKLEDNRIIIYQIDEQDNKTMYEITEITSEYLTNEDVLKLKEGIIIYGKENLIAVLEDYE